MLGYDRFLPFYKLFNMNTQSMRTINSVFQ